MGHDYTATALLAEIRRRSRIPSDDADFSDTNLLREVDSQLLETFVPLVQSMRGDHYVRYEDQTIVSGQAEYPIPSRSIGSRIRQVVWIDSADDEFELYPNPFTNEIIWQDTGEPCEYAVRDDLIVLLPTPSAAHGTLRIWYEYRPSKVVSSGYFVVDSVTSTTVTLTASVTWDADSRYDFVKATPPFTLLGVNADPSSTGSGTTLTFPAADIPSRLAAGDYMCLQDETPVPQLPAELHPALALAVAAEAVSQYDPAHGSQLSQKLGVALAGARSLLAPRARGRAEKMVNRNSSLRQNSYVRRSSWRW